MLLKCVSINKKPNDFSWLVILIFCDTKKEREAHTENTHDIAEVIMEKRNRKYQFIGAFIVLVVFFLMRKKIELKREKKNIGSTGKSYFRKKRNHLLVIE